MVPPDLRRKRIRSSSFGAWKKGHRRSMTIQQELRNSTVSTHLSRRLTIDMFFELKQLRNWMIEIKSGDQIFGRPKDNKVILQVGPATIVSPNQSSGPLVATKRLFTESRTFNQTSTIDPING
jgi:hypothetical protein